MDAESERSIEMISMSAGGMEMPAYSEFKDIVYRKLRLIGVSLGLDVLQPDFRPNFMTVITVFALLSTAAMCFSTSVLSDDDEMAMGANACTRLAFKVKYFPITIRWIMMMMMTTCIIPDHFQMCISATGSRSTNQIDGFPNQRL